MSHNNAIIMSHRKEVFIMPTIMPIRDLRNTSEISELAHKKQEPIFITKNGYSDLVVMSAALDSAMERLNKKYHG